MSEPVFEEETESPKPQVVETADNDGVQDDGDN